MDSMRRKSRTHVHIDTHRSIPTTPGMGSLHPSYDTPIGGVAACIAAINLFRKGVSAVRFMAGEPVGS